MRDINFQRSYFLGEEFEKIRKNADQILDNYMSDPNLVLFDKRNRIVTFSSERLIPVSSTKRPRVLLLFSNPHPYSIQQGMFLSPNTKGRKNLFWTVMKNAGWISLGEQNPSLEQLANICLNSEFKGPFDLIFYCYYAFPTCYPEEISNIFGKDYFKKIIEPEAKNEFKKAIQDLSIESVVTFNKGIFNLVSNNHIKSFIDDLKQGEVIQSTLKNVEINVPIFLTYPTGWRYHPNYVQLRKINLNKIKQRIQGEGNE
jgi:hypothetical protein